MTGRDVVMMCGYALAEHDVRQVVQGAREEYLL